MSYCPECGFQITEQKFCPNCGTKQMQSFTPACAEGINSPKQSAAHEAPSQFHGEKTAPKRPLINLKSLPAVLQGRTKTLVSHQQAAHAPASASDGGASESASAHKWTMRFSSRWAAQFAAAREVPDSTSEYTEKDIQENKGYSVLSYCSLFVFIPLLNSRNSAFVKFHANQGLNVFIGTILTLFARSVVLELVEMLRWPDLLTGLISVIASLPFIAMLIGLIVLSLLGISNAMHGKARQLPFIGKFDILATQNDGL